MLPMGYWPSDFSRVWVLLAVSWHVCILFIDHLGHSSDSRVSMWLLMAWRPIDPKWCDIEFTAISNKTFYIAKYYKMRWNLFYWTFAEELSVISPAEFAKTPARFQSNRWSLGKHDDVIKWKHFRSYWPFVRGIHRTTVGRFPPQRPVTRSFDVIFDLRLNKRLNKQSGRWWSGTPSLSLWRHCNVLQYCAVNILRPDDAYVRE